MSVDLRERRTTYAYGVRDPRYRKGYHRGRDKGADGGEQVQWLSSGTVTQITRNDSIGTWVETTNELGVGAAFIGYGHTRAPEGLRVGDRVTAGEPGPIVQGEDDDHGIDWDGSHVHLWTGNVSGDMGNAWGDDQDPAPVFDATPQKPTVRKDDEMRMIAHEDYGQLALVGETTFDLISVDQMKRYTSLYGAYEKVSDLTFRELSALVDRNRATIAALVKPSTATLAVKATDISNIASKVATAVLAKLPKPFKKLSATLTANSKITGTLS